jgi:hypothetical protein
VNHSISLYEDQASVSLPAGTTELSPEEKLDFFGKGEVPDYAYGVPQGDDRPLIWSIQHSELKAEPAEMAASRSSYRTDLEDFFEGAEWLSDTSVSRGSREWELLEFRTSGLHRWVYLTSWKGRILSCEFNSFAPGQNADLVKKLFESLTLE